MTIASLLLALIVTTAADTSTGEPVLLDFHASWCGPCQTMRTEVAKLAAKQYPIQSVDIDKSPEVAQRYQVTVVPTFIVADSQGRVLARTQGVLLATELAAFYNNATTKANSTAQRETQAPAEAVPGDLAVGDAQPTRTAPSANPLPWETVVRIKMHLSSKEWGFGSGTIIYSDEDESIILTCAHIFRDSQGRQQSLKNFHTKISVDLFDGKITNYKKPQLHCTERDIDGEAIDYDFTNDVGLIRIRPGRRLPASRVVSDSWEPRRGMKMYSVGCSHGNDATAWDTRILEPKVPMKSGNQSFFEMKCENQPSEGRSGGGLYTTDGYVAGVCDFADPVGKVGLYAVPKAIHNLLDRNQLMALYKAPTDGPNRLLASAKGNRTKVRAQSADEPAGPTEVRNFTIPDSDFFKIPVPETKVASNIATATPWRNGDLGESRKPGQTARRPDLELGAPIDPGPRVGTPVLTDLAMEPSSDSAVLDLPTPQVPSPKPVAADPASRLSAGKWKGVHTTRPRPESPN